MKKVKTSNLIRTLSLGVRKAEGGVVEVLKYNLLVNFGVQIDCKISSVKILININ